MSTRRVPTLVTGSLAAAFLLLLVACGGGASPQPGSSGTETPSVDASVGAASVSPSASPSGGSAPVTFPTTAEEYTKKAIAAWVAHDTTTLDAYEVSGGTLHGLSTSSYNTDFFLAPNFCQGAAGSSYCLYFNKYGDELLLRVDNQLLGTGSAHAIVGGGSFTPTTFPSDEQAYAEEALKAWQAGNDNRLKLLTKTQYTSAQVDALGPDRSANWEYDGSEGAAGSLYFKWKAGTHDIAFQFDNTDANPAPTSGSAAQHRILQIILITP